MRSIIQNNPCTAFLVVMLLAFCASAQSQTAPSPKEVIIGTFDASLPAPPSPPTHLVITAIDGKPVIGTEFGPQQIPPSTKTLTGAVILGAFPDGYATKATMVAPKRLNPGNGTPLKNPANRPYRA